MQNIIRLISNAKIAQFRSLFNWLITLKRGAIKEIKNCLLKMYLISIRSLVFERRHLLLLIFKQFLMDTIVGVEVMHSIEEKQEKIFSQISESVCSPSFEVNRIIF